MQHNELSEKTRELLNNAPRHIRDTQIAKANGVSQSWLYMFKTGSIVNSNQERIQKLHDYLISLQV